VLYPRSPRALEPDAFRRLRDRLPDPARVLAVLVNPRRTLAESLAREGRLHALQLHGDEPAGEWSDFPLPIWRAIRIENGRLTPDPACWPAARYVLDASAPGRYGGSGRTVDWYRAARAARTAPLMLAGGLTPDNVAEAVRRVAPLGVDVCSGVESEPGRKDLRRLAAFLAAARAAGRAAPIGLDKNRMLPHA